MSGREPEWLTAIAKDLPVQRRAAVLSVDCKQAMNSVLGISGLTALSGVSFLDLPAAVSPEAVKVLKSVPRRVTLVTGLEQEDFVARLLVEADSGLAKQVQLAADRPLRPKDLESIPEDATLAVAARVDPQQLLQGVAWFEKLCGDETKTSGADAVAAPVAGTAAPQQGVPAAAGTAEPQECVPAPRGRVAQRGVGGRPPRLAAARVQWFQSVTLLIDLVDVGRRISPSQTLPSP